MVSIVPYYSVYPVARSAAPKQMIRFSGTESQRMVKLSLSELRADERKIVIDKIITHLGEDGVKDVKVGSYAVAACQESHQYDCTCPVRGYVVFFVGDKMPHHTQVADLEPLRLERPLWGKKEYSRRFYRQVKAALQG